MADDQHSSRRQSVVKGYVIICLIKGVLAIALLTCAGLAVRFTANQEDTFGPPYYIGGFVVGIAMGLSFLISGFLCQRISQVPEGGATNTNTGLRTFLMLDMACTIIMVFGCFLGLFFCGIFGVKDCDPNEWASHCNYNENMSENRTIAIVLLLSLIASAAVAVASCCFIQRAVGSFLGMPLRQFRAGAPLVIVGGNRAGQVTHPPPEVGMNTSGVPVYNYPTATVTTVNYGTSAPTTNTWQGTTPGGFGAAPGGAAGGSSTQELEERNRLLQENIRLQREQLELQRQIQGVQDPSSQPIIAPPPSYDSVVPPATQIQHLQEQNKKLEAEYSRQQQLLNEKPRNFSTDGYITPSAPPP